MIASHLAKFGLDGLNGPHLLVLARRAVGRFFSGGCLQLSSAISYHAFLSIFPLLILTASIGAWFLDDEQVRTKIAELAADNLELSAEGEADLTAQLETATNSAGAAGLLAIPLLIWSASSMMTSIRHGINVAWSVPSRRQYLRGKLLDIGVVALLGAFSIASILATLLSRLFPQSVDSFWALTSVLMPPVLTFVAALLIFTFLPAVKTYARDVWPAALLAALLLEALKIGFAFYLGSISNANVIYGSLGAVISFLLFIYLAAAILLLTATFAAELPRVRAGIYDGAAAPARSDGLVEMIRAGYRQVATGRPEEDFRQETPKGPS